MVCINFEMEPRLHMQTARSCYSGEQAGTSETNLSNESHVPRRVTGDRERGLESSLHRPQEEVVEHRLDTQPVPVQSVAVDCLAALTT